MQNDSQCNLSALLQINADDNVIDPVIADFERSIGCATIHYIPEAAFFPLVLPLRKEGVTLHTNSQKVI